MNALSRRTLLRLLTGSVVGLPLLGRAQVTPRIKRLIVFYFPDGVPAPTGEASRFHPTGTDTHFALPAVLQPLAGLKNDCTFFTGLSLGPNGAGSHPEGAKKLLTGVDGGNGESLDQYLARRVGGSTPFPHLCLGAMATVNNPSSDKFVSYTGPGQTVAPEDNPVRAFTRLFGGGVTDGGTSAPDDGTGSVLDLVLADLNDLRNRVDAGTQRRLDQHLTAVREVEQRVRATPVPPPTDCQHPTVDLTGVDTNNLFDAARFPAVLCSQMDVLVTAMACGLNRVGVLQASQHTSELMMSAFPPLARPGFFMRSHEASHYGRSSDAKFGAYTDQRTWLMSQVAYLANQLRARPEGTGTMLDSTLILACSEVCDGNEHGHDNVPLFLVGGRAAVRTGRLFNLGYRRHSDLLLTIARAMGEPLTSWGQGGSGVIEGVLL